MKLNWSKLLLPTLVVGISSLNSTLTAENSNDKIILSDIKVESSIKNNAPGAVSFQSNQDGKIKFVLWRGSEKAWEDTLTVQAGDNDIDLDFHPYLGSGNYTVELFDGNESLQKLSLTVEAPNKAPELSALKNVTLDQNKYNFTVTATPNANAKQKLVLKQFIDNKLYAVAAVDLDSSETSGTGLLPENFMQNSRKNNSVIEFSLTPQFASAKDFSIEYPAQESGDYEYVLPKPINYGTFQDRYGVEHFWYMNHNYEYIFDGSPYFPVGGMWCPSTLLQKSTNITDIANQAQDDKKVLDQIQKYGINDVYLNLSIYAQDWVTQYTIDMLERRGINYGFQLTCQDLFDVPTFFITHDAPGAPDNWKGLIYGQYEDGKIMMDLPKSYRVMGLLVAPKNNPSWCRLISFVDNEGQSTRNNIIDLEKNQDFKTSRNAAVEVELPLKNGEEIVVIPLLNSAMHNANLWSPTERAKIKKHMEFVKRFNWGPNLRFFIDPISNETNMVNSSENLRQYSVDINRDFAQWLQDKYKTPEALENAWGKNIVDFATASRLVPLRLNEKLYLLDPEKKDLYPADLQHSAAWLDYNDMIRESYSKYTDEMSAYLKSLVNVPVVFKSVGVIAEQMNISQGYLGVDGIGFEIYLSGGRPGETGGSASKGEAELSDHTMWKVGTELGQSFNPNNDGVKFFKNEKTIRNLTSDITMLGVKGFYFFGVDLKPNGPWDKHKYFDFPEGLSWIKQIKKDYTGVISEKMIPELYVFPGGYTWWWWTTRNKALYNQEQNLLPQSVRINSKSQMWYATVNKLPKSFDHLIINCPALPFSQYYSSDIGKVTDGKHNVLYLGTREDVGTIPNLDQFFTDEFIEFPDGSIAQVLKNSGKDIKILAEKDGKIWALQYGKLVIISRMPKVLPVNNSDVWMSYVNEVLKQNPELKPMMGTRNEKDELLVTHFLQDESIAKEKMGKMKKVRDSRGLGLYSSGDAEIITAALVLSSGEIWVDANVDGTLTAELLDEDNLPIDGFNMANSIEQSGNRRILLQWRNFDPATIDNNAVKLRLKWNKGTLYTVTL